MKNLMSKSLLAFSVVTILVLGLKVSDSFLAEASTDNSNVCGVNNGVIWNGTACVQVCDQNHPWNPVERKCSTNNNYYYGNFGYGNNCLLAYGPNFYFNGQNCVELNPKPQANYYGNPYSGGVTSPVYGYVDFNSFQNTLPTPYLPTWIPNSNINSQLPNYIYDNSCYASCGNSNFYSYPQAKKIEYYIFTITTTVSQPQGSLTYFGQNYQNNQNYNYLNNLNYYGNQSTNQNFDYLQANYYGNDYAYPSYDSSNNQASYFNYGPSGYYDNQGVYHY